jgi:mono/diheme cytochrome c family protein
MKRIHLLFASAIIVAFVAGCGVNKPGKIESAMVKEIKKTMTIGDKDRKNPVPYTPDAAKEGQEHFGHHCQICHGLDGQNSGVPFAEKMSPPVPALTDKDVQDYTDGQLHWIIENGIAPSGMPAWRGNLDDDEMWKIVHYIRHLPPKGSLGTPEVYKEEAEQHEEAEHSHGKADESKPHSHSHTHTPGTPPHKD